MSINRELVLEKLSKYLDNEISVEDVYQWALSYAVSDEYDRFSAEDPLATKIIQGLMDVKHSDVKAVPSRKLLEYYKRCLVGEEEYKPEALPPEVVGATIPEPQEPSEEVVSLENAKKIAKRKKNSDDFFIISRIYVIIFGIAILCLQVFSILNPGVFDPGVTQGEAFLKAIPHLLYVFVALLPVHFTVRGILFYVAFPVLTLGMFFYWFNAVTLITKLSFNIIFVAAILPFSGIPATLAVFLCMICRQEIEQKRREAKKSKAAAQKK